MTAVQECVIVDKKASSTYWYFVLCLIFLTVPFGWANGPQWTHAVEPVGVFVSHLFGSGLVLINVVILAIIIEDNTI